MNTKQKIEVMQAWLDGETIQISSNEHGTGIWYDISSNPSDPGWDWKLFNYRIKPKEVKKPSINWDQMKIKPGESDQYREKIINLIMDDSSAMSFQSLKQYRKALLEAFVNDEEEGLK